MTDITASELSSVLNYNPDTGVLRWTRRVANNVFAGMEAGTRNGQGYMVFMYRRTQLQAHRVAWALTHGDWPQLSIDHINGNRADNRLCNLREATHQQNCCNRGPAPSNKCGLKGVRLKRGKWEACIWTGGRSVYLGRYESPEEAHTAYSKEATRLFGEFARVA